MVKEKNILKKEAFELGLKLSDVALKVGVNKATISGWVNGVFAPGLESYKSLIELGFSKQCAHNPSKSVKV